MEIIPSVSFRDLLEVTKEGMIPQGSISIQLDPKDVDFFKQMVNEGKLFGSKKIVAIENGSLDSYSMENLLKRKEQLVELFKLDLQYIELKHPFDTDLLEKIKPPKKVIVSFEDHEGIAKIDYSMLLSLHRKFPNLIFKIVATPENIVDVNQLIIWGKDMKNKNIKHVILCNGPFSSLTPFLHSKLSNDFIIYHPLEISEWERHSYIKSRIESICNDLLQEVYPGFEQKSPETSYFSERRIQNCIDPSSKKVAILGRSDLSKLENEFFRNFSDQMDVRLASVFVPLQNVEETNIFVQGIGKELFDGFSFIGSDFTRVETVDVFDISTAKTGITTFLLNKKGELISFDTFHILFEKILEPFLERDVLNVYIEGINPVLFSILPIFHSSANIIKIRNRNKKKLDIINQYFNKVEPVYPDEHNSYDIVINFVPFGTRGLPTMLPFPKKIIADASLIIDLTTSSKLTPLQQAAFSSGKTYYTGIDIIARKCLIEQQLIFRNQNQ